MSNNTIQWVMKVKPEENEVLTRMIWLFYQLGLIKKLQRSEFLRFCVNKTCKDIIELLKEREKYGGR